MMQASDMQELMSRADLVIQRSVEQLHRKEQDRQMPQSLTNEEKYQTHMFDMLHTSERDKTSSIKPVVNAYGDI